ncbi:unnamed protein product [Pedinophyceae sp. YPF-701]|nr:unnamed protein product [Pedinophyceae sp. YPF-701]
MLVDSTSSAIAGAMDNLNRRLRQLDEEIKLDQEGQAEYENFLRRLNARKDELKARVARNQAWNDHVTKELGPFLDKYAVLCKDIEQLYGRAKEKHAQGIQLLVDQFNYHESYKRWFDTFTGIPYKPA